jgi:hypothetical protein
MWRAIGRPDKDCSDGSSQAHLPSQQRMRMRLRLSSHTHAAYVTACMRHTSPHACGKYRPSQQRRALVEAPALCYVTYTFTCLLLY